MPDCRFCKWFPCSGCDMWDRGKGKVDIVLQVGSGLWLARKVWRSRWFIWIHSQFIWIHSKSVTWIEIEHIVPLYIEIRLRWHIYNADSSDNKFYCWIMLLRTRCFVNDVSCARILLTLFYESVRIILFEWTASMKLIVVFKNELL